ncbi:MAG TPA: hypothetical protein VHW91_06935 [Candidatus Dormibacteraeota bacterium]|nr:hypothetical protein [Candidatus Dormibacteraeota bacterium]
MEAVGGPNWSAAIAMIRDGGYVIYRAIGLTLREYRGPQPALGRLKARIQSSWQAENVTRERAIADLERGKATIQALVKESAEIRELARERGLEYELIDDYGMGAVRLATEVDGLLTLTLLKR